MMRSGFPNEVVVVQEDNHERRFTAKITECGKRYRGSMQQLVPYAIIEAGNGDFSMLIPQNQFEQIGPSTWKIVLPADVIRKHGGHNIRVGRIRFFSQFEVGEEVRVYAKTVSPRNPSIRHHRRLNPDWYVYDTDTEAGTVTLRNQNKGYREYQPIVVELSQLLRDTNDHLRAYVDGKHVIELEPSITEGDHNVAMSHDRVELQLGPYAHNQTGDAAVKAATEAFNLTDAEAASLFHYGALPVLFRVRPSQFARFMILRDQYGGVNDFKGMKAKLVQQEPPITRVDAAARPNRVTF